jgi:SAM-dependent methyltransferase
MKKLFLMILNVFTVICLIAAGSVPMVAQDLDVAYVESPPEVVELMMEISEIGVGDYVIDLGTGDGRILIAAAKRGALGHGIDLDPVRVKEAIENAEREGVEDKVSFIEEDLFDSKLNGADVITMFLNSEVNLRLRPTLLTLHPGTRIVSHNFDMGDWRPDRYQQILHNNNGNFLFHDVYYWIVPANASGSWQWKSGNDNYEMTVQQNYQEIVVTLAINKQLLQIESSYLISRRINVSATNPQAGLKYILSGSVEDGTITGHVQKRRGDIHSIYTWDVKR